MSKCFGLRPGLESYSCSRLHLTSVLSALLHSGIIHPKYEYDVGNFWCVGLNALLLEGLVGCFPFSFFFFSSSKSVQ